MARGPIPYLVLKTNGDATPGASATITIRGGGSATLYAAETGGGTLSNPVSTDSEGRIPGWLDEGSYDISISGAGITTTSRPVEILKGGGTFAAADNSISTSDIIDAQITKPKMAAGSVIFRTVHSFTVAGAIRIPSGDLDYLPPFRVHKTATQVVTLVQCSYRLNNGAAFTTVTFDLQKNGSSMTGFTSLVTPNSTAWSTATPTAITLADTDVLALVVTGISGSPLNFSATLVLEHSN